jgi:hypothetical protein
MWHDDVIEVLFNYTVHEKAKIIDILADRPTKECPNIRNLMLRAVLNTQRKYEIWLFGSDISESELYEQWNEDCELLKAAIRNVGDNVMDPREDTVVVH